MPDDILDSAQKQINDAATAAVVTPPPMPTPPPEPAPEPTPPPAPAPIETPVIETPAVEQVVPPPTPEPPQSPKSGKAGKIIAGLVLFFLLAAIPIGVYFNSKKQEVADTRSLARIPPPCKACVSNKCVDTNKTDCSIGENECSNDTQCAGDTLPPDSTEGQDCAVAGEAPITNRPCCAGLIRVQGGVCGKGGAKCPGTQIDAPGNDICNCTPEPQQCKSNTINATPTPAVDCSKTNCDSNGCSAGNAYGSGCVVYHYTCGNDVTPGQACLQNQTVGKSATFNGCGTEQIDLYCPVCGKGGGQGEGGLPRTFVSRFNQGTCGGGGTPKKTPTPPDVAPQCNQMKIYKGGAVVTDLSSLSVGDQIVIAVKGLLAKKAHVRINGGAWTETSTKNNKEEFTIDFTITADSIVNNKISIEGEIYGIDNKWH